MKRKIEDMGQIEGHHSAKMLQISTHFQVAMPEFGELFHHAQGVFMHIKQAR